MNTPFQTCWQFLSRLVSALRAGQTELDDMLQFSFVPEDVWSLPVDTDSV